MSVMRGVFWLGLIVSLLGAPLVVRAAPVAQEGSPFVGGEGVVSGQVVNGTADGETPVGAEVSLRAFDMTEAAFIDAVTITVAIDGSFRFEGIDPTILAQLEPLFWYQGIPYLSDLDDVIILTPEAPEVSANFVVYEITRDDNRLHFDTVHLLLEPGNGWLRITEVYGVINVGDRVYVGSAEQGGLFFQLPAEASNFEPMDATPGRYAPVTGGVVDTRPILPGAAGSQIVFSYDLPFSAQVELHRPLEYPTAVVNVVIPDDGTPFACDGLTPQESFEASGQAFRFYTAEALAPGTVLTMTVGGGGRTDSKPVLVGVVTLALATGLAFLYWSGRLGTWQGRSSKGRGRQTELIEAIAGLDDAYEAGQIKEKRYRSQRKALKDELIELVRDS